MGMWTRLTEVGREERRLEFLFRIGVAGCFIGHGAFGVIGKEAWLPYFAVAGIGPEWAWRLMPLVGGMDIAVGVLALLAPRPVFLAYAAFWAVWTALLRPLAGESFFEALERAGNYGVPIAFLIFAGASLRPSRAWLRPIRLRRLDRPTRSDVMLTLRATTATLLLGHGGLALSGKPLLLEHVRAVGLPDGALPLVGGFEVILALAVAWRPEATLLLGVLVWKLGTEALFPFTGDPFWEFVERAGSYVAPLALLTMVRSPEARRAISAPEVKTATMGLLMFLGGMLTGGAEAMIASASAQEAPSMLDRLRGGGHVIACRHAITDRSRGDASRVDFRDRSTQRVLSPAGEAQARRLGRILRDKGIPVGEVLASPYFRTLDSARLTFGRVETSSALYGRGARGPNGIARLLRTPPEPGTNRALVTHQGVLYRAFPDLERGSIREGDCLVVRSDGRDYEAIVRLGPNEWEALD